MRAYLGRGLETAYFQHFLSILDALVLKHPLERMIRQVVNFPSPPLGHPPQIQILNAEHVELALFDQSRGEFVEEILPLI